MLDVLTLDQLRTFVTVAESGSFRAGGVRLRRVQSAISHAIANLEGELGVSLFDRSGHRPVLTAQGEALLANARDILLRVDAMRARARGMSEGVELSLTLTVDTLFPILDVGTALAEVRAAFPTVGFTLAVEALGGPLDALLDKRSTLAILVGEDFRDPRVALEAMCSIEQVAVAAPRHPLGTRVQEGKISLPDLADHLQIVLADPTTLSAGRSFGVLSPQTCRVNTQDAKHAMIVAGLGWGRLPAWLAMPDLRAGRLVRLAVPGLGRDGELGSEAYIAHRLDEPLGPVGRALHAALLRCRPG